MILLNYLNLALYEVKRHYIIFEIQFQWKILKLLLIRKTLLEDVVKF